jgi:predicted nucleotidyltransferase
MDAEREYAELVEAARNDDNVVGLVLTGSRGSGAGVTDRSDWDVRLVVRDEARDEYRTRLGTPHGSPVEVVVLTLDELAAVGEVGSPTAWDRPSYVHAQVVVDTPDGRVSALLDSLGTLPPETARALAAEQLDDYVNSYHRSAKSSRLGNELESHLDAIESIPPLLHTLFALNGRVRPFNKLLRFELEQRPLDGDTWAVDELLPRLRRIAATGDIAEQQSLFRDVEELARAHGLDAVIDGWEPDVANLRGQS